MDPTVGMMRAALILWVAAGLLLVPAEALAAPTFSPADGTTYNWKSGQKVTLKAQGFPSSLAGDDVTFSITKPGDPFAVGDQITRLPVAGVYTVDMSLDGLDRAISSPGRWQWVASWFECDPFPGYTCRRVTSGVHTFNVLPRPAPVAFGPPDGTRFDPGSIVEVSARGYPNDDITFGFSTTSDTVGQLGSVYSLPSQIGLSTGGNGYLTRFQLPSSWTGPIYWRAVRNDCRDLFQGGCLSQSAIRSFRFEKAKSKPKPRAAPPVYCQYDEPAHLPPRNVPRRVGRRAPEGSETTMREGLPSHRGLPRPLVDQAIPVRRERSASQVSAVRGHGLELSDERQARAYRVPTALHEKHPLARVRLRRLRAAHWHPFLANSATPGIEFGATRRQRCPRDRWNGPGAWQRE